MQYLTNQQVPVTFFVNNAYTGWVDQVYLTGNVYELSKWSTATIAGTNQPIFGGAVGPAITNGGMYNPAQVTGIELRDNLVQLCQQAIQRCQLQGLQVYQGDVRSYTPTQLDVMIALHACDIATDYAIHTGIRLGAKVIMCAPCCHKQIRPQMTSPAILQPVLQHGVHLGQEAEMITDGLRALLLEACGYQTQVFEFVALEHTSKNKMILAVKKQISPSKQQTILAQIQAIKAF